MIPNLDKDATGRTFLIQTALAQLGFYKGAVDNWRGKGTNEAEAAFLAAGTPPQATEPVSGDFPQEAVNLMLEEEGVDQPGKWPGGGSGITLGFGCDIGADPASLEFWTPFLTPEEINRLKTARGITGRAAKQIETRFSDIRVTRADSLKVFIEKSLPREIAKTRQTFKGIDHLPSEVLGAMTSIVYNRGTDLDRDKSEGDRRLEMRNIADLIEGYANAPEGTDAKSTLEAIANQIQRMKRLWEGKGLDGLLTRRDREAKLVRNAIA